MRDLQHNVVSMLYTIKGLVETHLSRVDENRFGPGEDAASHARGVMNRIYAQTGRALDVTRRIGLAMNEPLENDELVGSVCIQEVWSEALGLLRGYYDLSGLQIIEHVAEDFPKVHCRPMELLEIFYCLAENAVHAMRPGLLDEAGPEKLVLRAQLEYSSDEEMLAHLTLADTGSGIPAEVLRCLFDPFMTTKSAEQGNGLGLCLVKRLVRKNGGRISVSSFRGAGTTFTLTFPVAKTDPRVPG